MELREVLEKNELGPLKKMVKTKLSHKIDKEKCIDLEYLLPPQNHLLSLWVELKNSHGAYYLFKNQPYSNFFD